MTQSNKQTREDRLKGVGIEGSMSRSQALGAGDPRGRRGAQRELDFHKRFDPSQFVVDENGRVSLRVRSVPTTRVVRLDFLREHGQAGTNPGIVDTSAKGGNPVYAAPAANWNLSDYGYFHFPIPEDFDRAQVLKLDVGCFERNGVASANVSWTLDVWSWEGGQDLARAADKTIQVVDDPLGAQDVDVRCKFEVPPGVITRGATSLKFKLTRNAATGTDPNGVGVHEILLTYGVKYSHSHG